MPRRSALPTADIPHGSQPLARPRLALAIPTYGRPEIVAENLAIMADEARRLGVPIYLSDDSPDDRTEQVAKRYRDLVTYRRNAPGLGHDRNVLDTLLWPDAEYVWLLGDSLRPRPGVLTAIIDSLADEDFTCINATNPHDSPLGPVDGEGVPQFLREFVWHQTLTGATIFHRRVLDWARDAQPPIYRNFPQLSVILGFCSTQPVRIAWWEKPAILIAPKNESYWLNRALDVFVGDWATIIEAHAPLFGHEHVNAVIRSHSQRTNLFSPSFLARLRLKGAFTPADLDRPHFDTAVHASPFWRRAALRAPRAVIALYRLRTLLTRIARG